MKKIKLSAVFNAFVIAVCIFLIVYFIFSKDGLRDLIKGSQGIEMKWIAAALFCHIGNIFVDCVLTWQFARRKYPDFTFTNGVKTAVTGHFFSAITPSSSGGQPMQVYCMSKMGVDVGFSSSMLLQKFVVFQVVATLYAAVLFAFRSKFVLAQINGMFTVWFVLIGFIWQVLVVAAVVLAGIKPTALKRLLRLFSPAIRKFRGEKKTAELLRKIDSKINVFRKSNRSFMKNPGLIALYLAEAAVQITLIYSVPYFVYRSLIPDGDGSWVTMLCSVAFVTVVSSMIPIPGASGVSELAFSVFFGVFFTPATLKSAILIWRTITYYFTVVVEGPLSMTGGESRKEIKSVLKSGNSER